MFGYIQRLSIIAVAVCSLMLWTTVTEAANPTAAQALGLTPIQDDVNYDRPTKAEAEKCSLEGEKKGNAVGWVVFEESGRVLRRFLDTNADNKVDQWCYYKDGVEVYRDIDSDFNGKAEQYRWLGTAGIRWGEDKNEDGRIDRWKMISAEEVTAELIASLRDKDSGRFERLLLTKEELENLGLGADRKKDLAIKIAAAQAGFRELATRQQVVAKGSSWVHFGGTRPGIVPAGSAGTTKDLIVYENVAAVVESDGKHSQVAVGTLIQVGRNWRMIDLPNNLLTAQANAAPNGFFFQASLTRRPQVDQAPQGGLSAEMQKLITDYETVDKEIGRTANRDQLIVLHGRRSDLLEKLETSSKGEERDNWIRQHAETLSAAIQSGDFVGGLKRLESLQERLAKNKEDAKLAGFAKFRFLSAAYAVSLQKTDADFTKIQEQWLKDLEQFVSDYPVSADAAEAMLQLALAQEFANKADEAIRWYGRIVNEFPKAELAKKAAGAQRRLGSVGKTISLRGRTLNGKTVDLSAYRNRVVLIHYWATWCEPCKQDLEVLKRAQAKYAKRGFELIGVSLDSDKQVLARYLTTNRLPWPQLYEAGGLENRLAIEMGVLTLPTMMLVDSKGKVVSRNIHAGEVETELSKLLK